MDYWQDGVLKGIAYWIYDFQVLIGSVLASIAAMITIHYVRKQISQTQGHRDKEVVSAKTAAKIEAVWELLNLSEYDDECLFYISESYVQKDSYKHVKGPLGAPPEIDLSVIPALSRLAVSSSPDISKKIQNYLAHLQIQNSRLKSLRDSLADKMKMPDGTVIHNPYVLETALLDHYILKFQTNRLLGYCRGDYDDVPDLMSKFEFRSEVLKFPDTSFTSGMIDYLVTLWPEEGWWKVR